MARMSELLIAADCLRTVPKTQPSGHSPARPPPAVSAPAPTALSGPAHHPARTIYWSYRRDRETSATHGHHAFNLSKRDVVIIGASSAVLLLVGVGDCRVAVPVAAN